MTEQITKNTPVTVTPKVDIMETETTVYLIAEMPGASDKNVDVDLQGNNLSIRGSTTFTVPDGMTAAGSEYAENRIYERQFTIGESIDMDKISASMKDGILRLQLPKLKELAPRKIVVKTE